VVLEYGMSGALGLRHGEASRLNVLSKRLVIAPGRAQTAFALLASTPVRPHLEIDSSRQAQNSASIAQALLVAFRSLAREIPRGSLLILQPIRGIGGRVKASDALQKRRLEVVPTVWRVFVRPTIIVSSMPMIDVSGPSVPSGSMLEQNARLCLKYPLNLDMKV
jgi:hypothetical protein